MRLAMMKGQQEHTYLDSSSNTVELDAESLQWSEQRSKLFADESQP
jgi:hypothetical protein